MKNQPTSGLYEYTSVYNVIPATVGVLIVYFGSKMVGIENFEKALVPCGMWGGVAINAIIWEKIEGVRSQLSKKL